MDGHTRFIAGGPRKAPGRGATRYPALQAALARYAAQDAAPELAPEPDRPPGGELREPGPGGQERGPGQRGQRAAGCLLLTRDPDLAQSLALIAVGAGVQLVQCRESGHAYTQQREVVLVGHDFAGEASGLFPAARLVLTGRAEHQDGLWRAAARSPGARVAVLPQAAAWLGEYLGEVGLHAGAARITLVAGGCGGAGTSTLAALLAATHTLAGQRTVLIDADRHSTGLWPMLRVRDPEGIGWEDLQHSRGTLAPGQLAEILPLAQGSAVLSWVRQPGSFVPDEALLTGVLAASSRIYDHLVIDAGRLPAVLPSMLALSDERLLAMPARCALNRGIPAPTAAPWAAVFTGKLAAGMDTRALAQGLGLPLGGYLPWLKAIERSAAEGRLLGVLARAGLRRRIAALGTPVQAAPGRAA